MVDFKINDITIKRIDKNIKTNIYPLFNLLDSVCFKIFDFPLAVKMVIKYKPFSKFSYHQ